MSGKDEADAGVAAGVRPMLPAPEFIVAPHSALFQVPADLLYGLDLALFKAQRFTRPAAHDSIMNAQILVVFRLVIRSRVLQVLGNFPSNKIITSHAVCNYDLASASIHKALV